MGLRLLGFQPNRSQDSGIGSTLVTTQLTVFALK